MERKLVRDRSDSLGARLRNNDSLSGDLEKQRKNSSFSYQPIESDSKKKDDVIYSGYNNNNKKKVSPTKKPK